MLLALVVVFHVYVEAPLAVSVAEFPAQIDGELIVMVGVGFTVT
jgi:hypothetical protein